MRIGEYGQYVNMLGFCIPLIDVFSNLTESQDVRVRVCFLLKGEDSYYCCNSIIIFVIRSLGFTSER